MTDPWRAVYDEAYELLIRKNRDYGTINISQTPGGALNGVMVRIWDKVSRLRNLFDQGREPENESVRDSFVDLLNYAAIALLVIRDQWDSGPGDTPAWVYKDFDEHLETLMAGVTLSDGRFFRLTEVLPERKVKAVDPDGSADCELHDHCGGVHGEDGEPTATQSAIIWFRAYAQYCKENPIG